jgi:hypothetical protein
MDFLSGINATTSSDGTALGWAHVAVTFDAAGRRTYYVSGEAVDDDDGNDTPMREAPPFFPLVLSHALVGGDQWAYPNAWSVHNASGFRGALNELQFYDYELSTGAVRSLAAGSAAGCRAVPSPPSPPPSPPSLPLPPLPQLAIAHLPPSPPRPPSPSLPPGARVAAAATLSARIQLSGAGLVDGVSDSAQSAIAAAAASAVRCPTSLLTRPSAAKRACLTHNTRACVLARRACPPARCAWRLSTTQCR